VSVQNTKAGQSVVVKNRNYAEKSPQLGTHFSVLPMEEIVDISGKFLQANKVKLSWSFLFCITCSSNYVIYSGVTTFKENY
jgi:hypothetical protein